MSLINQSNLLPHFFSKKNVCWRNMSRQALKRIAQTQTSSHTKKKKKTKNFIYLINLKKKPRQFNGVLSPVRDNRYCYSVVFENVRFQPSTHNKYGKAEFSKFGSPGYVLKEAQTAKETNKQRSKYPVR